ncbi:MAG TPA: pantoate--beta-alanine ligase [Bacteroidia bacterium]|nr:pantoate--beta-alanine ligase [Bacteroidia bacterium]
MITITTRGELSALLDTQRKSGKKIGFVPTMGALHEGHASLVAEARRRADTVVVSIFVNPTQFNDAADLKNYPRTPGQDAVLLEKSGADILFLPSVHEMYPNGTNEEVPVPDIGILGKVMEAAHRPGHFEGVINIVSRLFTIVGECTAFFGEKDFQQLAVIRKMVREMNMNVVIVGCPIVRESDGLAMSSRNARLGREERAAAPFISQVLFRSREMWNEKKTAEEIKRFVKEEFEKHSLFRLEYFEIADAGTLEAAVSREGKKVACIAAWLGSVRLIDNVVYA